MECSKSAGCGIRIAFGVCDPDHSNGLKCLKLAANGAIMQSLKQITKTDVGNDQIPRRESDPDPSCKDMVFFTRSG